MAVKYPRTVVYALSPFHQKITTKLWKNWPEKMHQKVSENWINASLLITPLVGTYAYAWYYKEKEKLAHRY